MVKCNPGRLHGTGKASVHLEDRGYAENRWTLKTEIFCANPLHESQLLTCLGGRLLNSLNRDMFKPFRFHRRLLGWCSGHVLQD